MSTEWPITEGYIPFRKYHTWYRIIGNLTQPTKRIFPLLVLHGGPGVPHESLEPLELLAREWRPVIFYDQLGCGNSDIPNDLSLWNLQLFLDELETIRRELNLEHVHLFGHSWGGMLALEHALRHPTALMSLILASTPANTQHMFVEQHQLWEQFPDKIRALLRTGSETDYQQALTYYNTHHYCRRDPWPAFLLRARSREKRNAQLNNYMWNTSDIPGSGSLNSWDIRPRLLEINIPTLITAGRYDGMAVKQGEILHHGIPPSEYVLFEDSSHYAHAEETERYLTVLDTFLSKIEHNSK